jgi:hypothetical protein
MDLTIKNKGVNMIIMILVNPIVCVRNKMYHGRNLDGP